MVAKKTSSFEIDAKRLAKKQGIAIEEAREILVGNAPPTSKQAKGKAKGK